MFYAIGAIIAPLLGSMVYAMLNDDWWYTCDVFAIISSVYVVIFFVFNVMPDLHKERQQRLEMAEKMIVSEHFTRVININIIKEEESESGRSSEENSLAKDRKELRATALFAQEQHNSHEVEVNGYEKLDDEDNNKKHVLKQGLLTTNYTYQQPSRLGN